MKTIDTIRTDLTPIVGYRQRRSFTSTWLRSDLVEARRTAVDSLSAVPVKPSRYELENLYMKPGILVKLIDRIRGKR